MQRKGINYDVGTNTEPGSSSRPVFDRETVAREIGIIKTDLHCNAIRISGEDLEWLLFATECALRHELEVWFSPARINATRKETLDYFRACARALEPLRAHQPAIVFVTGTELTFFMQELVAGDTPTERMTAFMKPWRLLWSALRRGSFNKNLNQFLAETARAVREEFHGPLTYASGTWESVDWSPFDFVGVDYYRDTFSKNKYGESLTKYSAAGKPVVITEFGCCTYEGAQDKGGYGWAIVDRSQNPPRLKGDFQRSEATQAKLIAESLDTFERAGVDGAFVFTFVMPKYPYQVDPRYDLDMASYGIVKYLGNSKGTTYPDMPWEPKQAFSTVSAAYRKAGA